jgi:DNA-directed RNA polymerase specialized sigma24 family protein
MHWAVDPSVTPAGELAPPRDVTAWPDEWLMEAVRRDPPDEAALDALAGRHWKALFGRCQLLTLDRDEASDLAQEAWCRVLRARHSLKPDGNFPGYLATIATNVWRDRQRSARRAGPMAESRMASLDATLSEEEGDGLSPLLVRAGFDPPARLDVLPQVGGDVLARTIVEGKRP